MNPQTSKQHETALAALKVIAESPDDFSSARNITRTLTDTCKVGSEFLYIIDYARHLINDNDDAILSALSTIHTELDRLVASFRKALSKRNAGNVFDQIMGHNFPEDAAEVLNFLLCFEDRAAGGESASFAHIAERAEAQYLKREKPSRGMTLARIPAVAERIDGPRVIRGREPIAREMRIDRNDYRFAALVVVAEAIEARLRKT
jgi:hypothetical protein